MRDVTIQIDYRSAAESARMHDMRLYIKQSMHGSLKLNHIYMYLWIYAQRQLNGELSFRAFFIP